MAPDEKELVILAQKGNTAAFEQLVFRYDKNVLSLALKYIQDNDLAKDIYQEVFIRVYRGLKNFQFKSEFSTWLFRITTNVCLTYKSKKQSSVFVSINEENDEGDPVREIRDESWESSPDLSAFGSEVQLRINKALEEIPAKQKMVFVLKHFEGYKLREIADMMECQEGTVKKYLFEEVHTLREKLKDLQV
jgi:RNA polymerase sigma-70 factor (ECF subfamily)